MINQSDKFSQRKNEEKLIDITDNILEGDQNKLN